jgi:multiple sugar transport system permease protein
MRGVYHVDWGLLSSAAILVMVVPIVVYLILQRYYIRGMVGWSLK